MRSKCELCAMRRITYDTLYIRKTFYAIHYKKKPLNGKNGISTGSVVLEQARALRVDAAFPMQKRMSVLIHRMFKTMRLLGFSDDWRIFNPMIGGVSTRRLARSKLY